MEGGEIQTETLSDKSCMTQDDHIGILCYDDPAESTDRPREG